MTYTLPTSADNGGESVRGGIQNDTYIVSQCVTYHIGKLARTVRKYSSTAHRLYTGKVHTTCSKIVIY